MTIHVREPKNGAECIARIKEQREKIFNPPVRPVDQPQLVPAPMPVLALPSSPSVPRPLESPNAHRARIIREIAEKYGVAAHEIVGRAQRPHVMTARDAAIAAVREAYPKRSLARIGQDFNRDHSTIITSLRRTAGYPSNRKGSEPRYGRRPLALVRLEQEIKFDLMKALCADGWTCRQIAEVMECTISNARKVTQDLREAMAAAQGSVAEPAPETPAQPQPEPEVIPQPAPKHAPFRQLLSHVRNWFGARA